MHAISGDNVYSAIERDARNRDKRGDKFRYISAVFARGRLGNCHRILVHRGLWSVGHIFWSGDQYPQGFRSGRPGKGQDKTSTPGNLVQAVKYSSSIVCLCPACFSMLHAHQEYLMH